MSFHIQCIFQNYPLTYFHPCNTLFRQQFKEIEDAEKIIRRIIESKLELFFIDTIRNFADKWHKVINLVK